MNIWTLMGIFLVAHIIIAGLYVSENDAVAVFMSCSQSHTFTIRGTLRRTRLFPTTSKTSGRASIVPAQSPSSTRVMALRKRRTMKMKWMTMMILSQIGTCVSSMPRTAALQITLLNPIIINCLISRSYKPHSVYYHLFPVCSAALSSFFSICFFVCMCFYI